MSFAAHQFWIGRQHMQLQNGRMHKVTDDTEFCKWDFLSSIGKMGGLQPLTRQDFKYDVT